MSWNFDFDISAVLFITVLIIYYNYRKWLPLFRNRLFLFLMESSVAVALTDIIASVISVQGMRIPVSIMYASNLIYYIFLMIQPAIFFCYTLSLVRFPVKNIRYIGRIIAAIPFAVSVVFILSSPWTGWIFSIDDNHEFVYGNLRPVLFYITMLYFFMGVIFIMFHRNGIRKLVRYPLYIYVLFTAVGHIYQVFYNPYLQTLSLGSTFGLLIIFLAYQNPDYDRERKTGMFREKGIQKLINEDVLYGIHRIVGEVAFENYVELRSIYGEEISSSIIREVAVFLRKAFPAESQFYVHNGRFVVMFRGKSDSLKEYREIIQKRCEKPFYIETFSIYLSPVFSFTLGDIEIKSQPILRDCMKIATDLALKKGKGTTVRVTPEILHQVLYNRKVENALKNALKEDSLLVYYQPIFSTQEMRVTGAEALVRIEDRELGILYPDEFISIAEKNGSILSLGEQVFKKVCMFVQNHDMDALGLSFIEVNLSPLQCMREKISEEFERIMREYQVNPKYIGLEITESAVSDIEVIKNNMENFVIAGVKLALDDYGTGYSNLINILSLPLSIVKIDKSIVWAYFREGNDFLLSVIRSFENKGLHLVVEGVETKEMAEKLEEMGVHYEQGYFYSKPIPESEFLQYVEKGQWNQSDREK